MEIGTEISQKIKTAIKSKLVEFGSYVDDELPDYIMVMVANKRSQSQMVEDLNLFLADNSKMFCEWLHELLHKLQEVTEGAFEVKVPIKLKLDDVKNENKTNNSDSLKISKISKKLSPGTSESNHRETSVDQNEDAKTNEKYIEKETKNNEMLQSVVTMQIRPTLPLSKQANSTLLKKAMKAVQLSSIHQSEYNPELPSSTDVQNVNNAESKRRQRELLLEEHKKLQRIKSEQDEDDMDEGSKEPVIELQVEQDDDLFATEEYSLKDQRIVVDRSAEPADPVVEVAKKEKSKREGTKDKKPEKRKMNKVVTNNSGDKNQPGSSSEEDESHEKHRSVKTKEKKKKPKFIVTLEGVGQEFEEKYEKDHSRKKRRRASHKEDDRLLILNKNIPPIPVYPPFIPGVHQVRGIPPTFLNPIQMPVIPNMIPELPVETATSTVTESLENEDEEMPLVDGETCRFWPQCKNGDDCPYYHPGVDCKHFPNCRYGKDCSYLHPPCKFGSKCTSSLCYYSHLPTTSAVSSEMTTLCRYHPFCTKKDCPFLHPTEKPCRYGSKCTRPGCAFNHSTPPPREQLKWVAPKPHVSDRQFAVKEASTTPLPVQ